MFSIVVVFLTSNIIGVQYISSYSSQLVDWISALHVHLVDALLMDAEADEEAEAGDEEGDHAGSAEAVPRSDADHLRQLDSLGITAVPEEAQDGTDEPDLKKQRAPDEDQKMMPLEEPQMANQNETGSEPHNSSFPSSKQRLRGGTHWFREPLHGSALGNGQAEMVMVRHGLIRACNCHVEVADGSADIFAGRKAAVKAKRLLCLSAHELQTTVQQDTAAVEVAMPEAGEEEETLESLEMSWATHPGPSFLHQTVRPSFIDPTVLSFQPTLKSWTFKHELDPIQSRAIACVESHESVLLCAPTSAGKTAVATYAVAMALHLKSRAIYTTPIKALSNQKFLDFGKGFGGQFVGIMTGDTVIASDAPIVVMTLEILQSMLYKQARDPNLLDDFQCVVIDEAHFLGDLERGYAWEEVLILLPPHITLVLLSATMPNWREIADWCARIRTQPMHVITSDQRPVSCALFGLYL